MKKIIFDIIKIYVYLYVLMFVIKTYYYFFNYIFFLIIFFLIIYFLIYVFFNLRNIIIFYRDLIHFQLLKVMRHIKINKFNKFPWDKVKVKQLKK